jgi:hypothetical protein
MNETLGIKMRNILIISRRQRKNSTEILSVINLCGLGEKLAL